MFVLVICSFLSGCLGIWLDPSGYEGKSRELIGSDVSVFLTVPVTGISRFLSDFRGKQRNGKEKNGSPDSCELCEGFPFVSDWIRCRK